MKLSGIWVWAIGIVVVVHWSGRAGAQDNVKGAEPIDQSIDVGALHYDYLVDGNLAADDPANKKFKTVQAAYEAAPAGSEGHPTVIGIEPGVYAISGSEERVPSMSIRKDWISLLGMTNDRRAVVLADNRGLDEGASDDGYMLDVNATGFCARNLTLLNYCNCDYEYPGDATKSLKMRNPTITQAVALQAAGDKHVYDNVAILSRLDTMFLRTQRSYFRNVYIEGTDDWMGGGQMSVWQDCELVYPTGKGVMSASNCVFFNCRFGATRGMEFYKAEFGSAARPDALINCVLPVSTEKNRVAWVRGVAVARPNQYSLTYKNTDEAGKPAVIYDDTASAPAFTYSRELSDEEMRAYNPWNLLRGADGWDPAGVREKYEKDGKGVYRMTLRMGDRAGGTTRGAGIGSGLGGGSPAVFATVRTGGPGVRIGASVLPRDAQDKTVRWSAQSDLVELSGATGPDVVVTGKNGTEEAEFVPVTAMGANGFYVTAWVYVEPKFIDPPKIVSAVKVDRPKDGKVAVEYGLDLGKRKDQSLVMWYVCDDAAGKNPRKVAVSRGGEPLKEYTLMPGDVGKYLKVSVEPKIAISEAGPAISGTSDFAVVAGDVPSSTVTANFRNFVETRGDELLPGEWSVVGSWMVVPRGDLLNGYGARAGTGARGSEIGSGLFYFPPPNTGAKTGDMQVELVITPDKTEGTVFAVPGSPAESGERISHGDIYIKYDPVTKNGYSLRYWRTTKSAAACTYQFYKIVDGVGSPLSDQQVQSGVFKRNTNMTLKVSGNTISVEAKNTADDQTLRMEGKIEPNDFGGAGVSGIGEANIYDLVRVTYR